MAEDKLVQIGGALAVPEDAFEVDFAEIQRITPNTLRIDQPNSTVEGAQVGMLRIVESGLLRKEIRAVMIEKPYESRAYSIGKFPNKKRVCFSYDMIRPSDRSEDVQAMVCSGCKHNNRVPENWATYRKTKDSADAPQCEDQKRILLIDYELLYPLKAYVHGKSKEGLEEGMQQILQHFVTLKMKNGGVKWTDVAFTLTTEKITGNANYKLKIKDVNPITETERNNLAQIVSLISQQKAAMLARIAAQEEAKVTQTADESVTAAVMQAGRQAPTEPEYIQGSSEEV